MPVIVVPDDEPPVLSGTVLEERLRRFGEVLVYNSRALGDQELISRIKDADIAYNIRSTSVFTDKVLRACPGLKLIAVYGVGYDNVDVKAATELGITVANTPGYSTIAVSEMALAMMLSVARRVAENDGNIRSGGWARGYGAQLYGKTLGVIGTGNIGQRVIHLGKAIGMKVIAWTRHPSPGRASDYGTDFVGLPELLQKSDVVTIHIPGGASTEKFIAEPEIAMMRPTTILINTARGSVVDESALVTALKEGKIAGAGLDVFVTEPLPPEHALRSLKNVVLSPHTAAMVPEATLLGLGMAVDNVASFLQGQPTNVVNPSR